MSYTHIYSTGEGFWYLDETDRMLVNLPMFHIGGTLFCHMALVRGGSIAMVEAFQTDKFWPTIKTLGVTFLYLLGVMASFVMKREDTGDEKNSPLRHFGAIPLSEEADCIRRALWVHGLLRLQHDGGLLSPRHAGRSEGPQHLRPAATRRRGPHRRR